MGYSQKASWNSIARIARTQIVECNIWSETETQFLPGFFNYFKFLQKNYSWKSRGFDHSSWLQKYNQRKLRDNKMYKSYSIWLQKYDKDNYKNQRLWKWTLTKTHTKSENWNPPKKKTKTEPSGDQIILYKKERERRERER